MDAVNIPWIFWILDWKSSAQIIIVVFLGIVACAAACGYAWFQIFEDSSY